MGSKRLKTTFVNLATAAAVAILSVLTLVAAGQATAQVRNIIIDDGLVSRIELAPGTTITVETNEDFADILIGNTDVLDVFPLTDRSLYIQAKSNGVTNITLYSVDKQLLEVIDVKVRLDFTELEKAIRQSVPSAQVSVQNVNNRIRLSGVVKDNVDEARVVQLASQFTEQPVINSIKVKAAQQVELDVRILEVNRSSGRELGISLDGRRENGTVAFETGRGASNSQLGIPFGTAVGSLLEIAGIQIDFVINALEAKGLARRLANPKLVTTSGIAANFVVGGEVPIAQTKTDDNGNVASETGYRQYGVRLNFLPQILDDQMIRLRIAPEVSDIDPSLTVNGQPAFITRSAETTVSLRNGQSFAIAGLLQANNARNTDQLPWLGQVPILGTLFSSRSFQKRETDLVILVTPRLVAPVGPDTPLSSPLDQTRSSNDVELFLLGMLEVDRKLLNRFRDGHGVVGPYGHIIDLEFEDGIIKKK